MSVLKKTVITVMVLLFVISLCSCQSKPERVITNVDKIQEKNDTDLVVKKDQETNDIPDKKTPEVLDGDVPGDEISEDESSISENAEQNKEPIEKGKAQQYKGYKGPVQGEIKYKEGTPSTDNSQEYKASGDIESPYHIDLVVTKDFGNKKIFDKTVGLVRDEVGMEVLFRNLDIQTAYGGGFVNSINGIESQYTFFTGSERKKLDWFYWVNGILAPIGVAEYRPQPGDTVWWDYHDWSVTMFLPAVIGSYPQPFKSGFGGKNPGTVIMYTEEYEQEAEELKRSLTEKGVEKVDVTPYDPEQAGKSKKYHILLGVWDKLSEDSDKLKDINKKNKLIGVYVKFADGKLHALDFKGKSVSTYEKAGAVYAYGADIGSMYPTWLITGTDDDGLKMALNTLLDNSQAIYKHFGSVMTENKVENVPYAE